MRVVSLAAPAFHPAKRTAVIIALIVVTAFSFWFFSRYPDLDRWALAALN